MDHRETSLDAYFSSKLPLPPEDQATVNQALSAVHKHALSRIKAPHKIKPRTVVSLSFDASIPALVAKHKLVEAKNEQKTLQDKLVYVTQRIEELQTTPHAPNTSRKTLQHKRRLRSRREQADSADMETGTSELTSKRENSDYEGRRSESHLSRLALIRKLQREKEDRKLKLQTSLEQRELRIAQKLAEEQGKSIAEKAKSRDGVIEELKKRHEIVEKRKEERKRFRVETDKRLKEVKLGKPLYATLEEKYEAKFVYPEVRRLQEVLGKKKEMVDISALMKHAKEVRTREVDLERKRLEMRARKMRELKILEKEMNFYRPKVANIIEEETEQRKLAPIQKVESTKQLFVKKQRYGFLVRELFKPKTSKLKQLELEYNKQRATPGFHKPGKNSVSAHSERESRTGKLTGVEYGDQPRSHRVKTRKSRSAQSLPPPEPLKPKPKDYLAEQRRYREASHSSHQSRQYESKWQLLLNDSENPERISDVQKEVQRMETWARDQESRLNHMELDWKNGVETREAVSTLYLDSIRAKLALLEELT